MVKQYGYGAFNLNAGAVTGGGGYWWWCFFLRLMRIVLTSLNARFGWHYIHIFSRKRAIIIPGQPVRRWRASASSTLLKRGNGGADGADGADGQVMGC